MGFKSPREYTLHHLFTDGSVWDDGLTTITGSFIAGLHIETKSASFMHRRSIYNLLDYLGDVGGLKEALTLLGQFLLSVLGTGGLQGHLIRNLLKIRGPMVNLSMQERSVSPTYNQVLKAKKHVEGHSSLDRSMQCCLLTLFQKLSCCQTKEQRVQQRLNEKLS